MSGMNGTEKLTDGQAAGSEKLAGGEASGEDRTEEREFRRFVDIVGRLRDEDGCPWDRAQTHESLRSCLIEEAYETIEAINRKNKDNLCEELGDVLLQVVLHARIAQEEGAFTMGDVIQGIAAKMVRRHPHVFGTEEEKRNPPGWEEIKRREKEARGEQEEEGLFGVPAAFPALIRAEKMIKQLAKEGISLEEVFAREDALRPVSGQEEEERECLRELLLCVDRLRRKAAVQTEQAVQDYLDGLPAVQREGQTRMRAGQNLGISGKKS